MNENFEYISFSLLHNTIMQAKHNALKSVNADMVNLNWQVGAFVSKQLSQSKWGEKTVQQFSDFLREQDPSLKGFDRKSIYRMVQFYDSYKSAQFVVPVERQLQANENKQLNKNLNLKLSKQNQQVEKPIAYGKQSKNTAKNQIVAPVERQLQVIEI